MKKYALYLSLALLITLDTPAYAQTRPDAGVLQQRLEKERKSSASSYKEVQPAEISPYMKKTPPREDTFKVTVKNFLFEGNTLLGENELIEVVKQYLNHPINFSELQDAAAAVGEAYRAKGWVVRSFVPEQSIKHGVITIKIIEAKFGKTQVEGDSTIRLKQDKVEAIVSSQQNGNEPINTKKIDRALLLVDDLPGVSISGRLREGERYGETDLVLK